MARKKKKRVSKACPPLAPIVTSAASSDSEDSDSKFFSVEEYSSGADDSDCEFFSAAGSMSDQESSVLGETSASSPSTPRFSSGPVSILSGQHEGIATPIASDTPPRMIIPRKIRAIMAQFESEGFICHIYGGSPFDWLNDRTPSDVDLETNASLENIEKIIYRITSTYGLIASTASGIIYQFYLDGMRFDISSSESLTKSACDPKQMGPFNYGTAKVYFDGSAHCEYCDALLQETINLKPVRLLSGSSWVKEPHLMIRFLSKVALLQFQKQSQSLETKDILELDHDSFSKLQNDLVHIGQANDDHAIEKRQAILYLTINYFMRDYGSFFLRLLQDFKILAFLFPKQSALLGQEKIRNWQQAQLSHLQEKPVLEKTEVALIIFAPLFFALKHSGLDWRTHELYELYLAVVRSKLSSPTNHSNNELLIVKAIASVEHCFQKRQILSATAAPFMSAPGQRMGLFAPQPTHLLDLAGQYDAIMTCLGFDPRIIVNPYRFNNQ